MSEAGVYMLVCEPTGQIYIGSAVNWRVRGKQHLRGLKAGRHANSNLQALWNEHGESNFKFSCLEICKQHYQLADCEKKWKEHFSATEKLLNIANTNGHSYYLHGMTNTRTFKSWESMLQRCTNKNAPDYPRYGGRGIKVCARWRNSFTDFLADMGERPEGMSLDRFPDKTGNYEPNNCRWATASQQQKNKGNSLHFTHSGITKPVIEWAAEWGIPYGILSRRIKKGVTGDQLLAPTYWSFKGAKDAGGKTTKRYRSGPSRAIKYTAHGKILTRKEWAEELGVTADSLYTRLKRMSPTAALVSGPLKKGPKGPHSKIFESNRCVSAFGRTQTVTQWAEERKLPVTTLRNRLFRAKMKPEDALNAPIYAQQRQGRRHRRVKLKV